LFSELRIQNFQNHSKLKVDLDPKITTITGRSDVGKSAILRALKWVCLNSPQGESFIKNGEPGTTVQLIVDDRKIVRKRGKGDNLYLIEEEEFKAFSSNVPDEIAKILNVGDKNFQGQHDSVFWFSQSAGEVSRQLNSVVDLGVIDDSLANVAKKVRHYQTAAEINRERLQKSKTRRESLAWVVDANNDYAEVERKGSCSRTATAVAASLRELVQGIVGSQKAITAATGQYSELRSMGILAVSAKKSSDKKIELSKLIQFVRDQKKVLDRGVPDILALTAWYTSSKTIESDRLRLSRLIGEIKTQKVILARGIPDFSGVESFLKSYNEARDKRIRLRDSLLVLRGSVLTADEEKKTSEQVHKELEEKLEGKCPVCGKEL